jgi:hypothetical protein
MELGVLSPTAVGLEAASRGRARCELEERRSLRSGRAAPPGHHGGRKPRSCHAVAIASSSIDPGVVRHSDVPNSGARLWTGFSALGAIGRLGRAMASAAAGMHSENARKTRFWRKRKTTVKVTKARPGEISP